MALVKSCLLDLLSSTENGTNKSWMNERVRGLGLNKQHLMHDHRGTRSRCRYEFQPPRRILLVTLSFEMKHVVEADAWHNCHTRRCFKWKDRGDIEDYHAPSCTCPSVLVCCIAHFLLLTAVPLYASILMTQRRDVCVLETMSKRELGGRRVKVQLSKNMVRESSPGL